jgi:hypothetical protein
MIIFLLTCLCLLTIILCYEVAFSYKGIEPMTIVKKATQTGRGRILYAIKKIGLMMSSLP